MSVTCIVSNEVDVRVTADALIALGHDVKTGDEVASHAHGVLSDGRFVLIGHGEANGTFFLSRSGETGTRWLWVGMPSPPLRSRLYVYACHAGMKLVPELKDCEVFGHCHIVPVVKEEGDCVSRFLDLAVKLTSRVDFDSESIATCLMGFLDSEMQSLLDGDDAMNAHWVIYVLRRSLGFGGS